MLRSVMTRNSIIEARSRREIKARRDALVPGVLVNQNGKDAARLKPINGPVTVLRK